MFEVMAVFLVIVGVGFIIDASAPDSAGSDWRSYCLPAVCLGAALAIACGGHLG